ncbi:hypothetical protein GCM10009853_017540 [Glycomyces scopariae]
MRTHARGPSPRWEGDAGRRRGAPDPVERSRAGAGPEFKSVIDLSCSAADPLVSRMFCGFSSAALRDPLLRRQRRHD